MAESHSTGHEAPANGRQFGGLLDAPPKTTFALGFLGGVVFTGVILGIIAFGVLASGGSIGGGSAKVAGITTTTNTNTAAPAQPTAPTAPTTQTFAIGNDDHIRGDANAQVTVVEFSDLECPFCKQFHPTMKQLLSEYGNKVRWVYKHFPLTSLHPKAQKEAEASECAWDQKGNDGFWSYVDKVYEVTPSNNGLDAAELPKIAEQVGLNKAKFEDCLNSGKFTQKVQADYQEGISKGVQGTPSNFVNGTPVAGAVPYDTLKSAVESALQ